jgi:hypothetical protein
MKRFFLFCLFLNPLLAQADQNLSGLTIAGFPSGSFQSGRGIKYGGRVHFIQYGNGVTNPYNWNLSLDASNTTENQFESIIFLDMPDVIGKSTRFDFLIQHSRLRRDDYYGIGNNNIYNPDFSDKASIDFLNRKYNNLKHQWLAAISNIQFPIAGTVKGLCGIGMYSRTVTPFTAPNKLAEDSPAGINGGQTNYIRTGILYDSRNEESVPTNGVWFDAIAEYSHTILNSDYNFTRLTVTDRRYFTFQNRVTFAQRLFLEMMPGNPPFYDMSVLGNSFRRQEGLGGAYSLRGIPRFLFIGPHKFLANFELRLKVKQKTILQQPLTLYIHLFSDVGRVWIDQNIKLSDFHSTQGFGIHVKWKKDFIGALDIGRSKFKSLAVYATFGNLF